MFALAIFHIHIESFLYVLPAASYFNKKKGQYNIWRLKPRDVLVNFCATQPVPVCLRLSFNFVMWYLILPASNAQAKVAKKRFG